MLKHTPQHKHHLFNFTLIALFAYLVATQNRIQINSIDTFISQQLIQPLTTQPLLPSTKITILEINDADLAKHGPWPWDRALQADAIAALNQYQPALIALSLLVDPNKSGDAGTQLLTHNLSASQNLVAGFKLDFTTRNIGGSSYEAALNKGAVIQQASYCATKNPGIPCLFDYQQAMRAITPLSSVAQAAHNLGFLDYASPQGVAVYPTVAQYQSTFYKSYPVAIAQSYLGNQPNEMQLSLNEHGVNYFAFNQRRIETLPNGTFILRPYAKQNKFESRSFPHISYSDLIDGKADATLIKDHIVLFDLTAQGYAPAFNFMRDELATRAVIHATAVANIIEDNYIRYNTTSKLISAFLVILGIVATWWVSRKVNPLQAILATFLVIPACLLLVGYIALNQMNLWVMLNLPLTASIVNFAGQFGYRHFFAEKQRRVVERALTGYTSKAVMDNLINQGESFLNSTAERRDLTVLIFDIKGFTQLAHRLTPEETFKLLNAIFNLTDEIITTKYNGMIDKKMGDACIALFGLDGKDDHPLRAVQAALDIQENLFNNFSQLSQLAHKHGIGPGLVQLRIGISTGTVCLGNVGSKKHFNFTAVGDVVNMCQRLESACTPGDVLISEETFKRCHTQLDASEQHAQGKRQEEYYLAYKVNGIKN